MLLKIWKQETIFATTINIPESVQVLDGRKHKNLSKVD